MLQHTPDSFQSIQNSQRILKKGGSYVLDHYTHSLSYYTKTTAIVRKIISKWDKERKYQAIERIFKLFYPLHYAVRKIYILQVLLSRISPVHVYFRAYPELSDELQKEWALLDTHDSLADTFKSHLPMSAIRKFLDEQHYKIEYIGYAGNGVEARFIK